MTEQRTTMSLGMNILGLGGHDAAWRLGEVDPQAHFTAAYYQNIARLSERGTLDGIFLADGPALAGEPVNTAIGRLEPTVLLTAIAAVTERIGVIATASTSFNDPYNLARRILSLDHVSGGRAAWNAVTSAGDAVAQNFGKLAADVHSERYRRADEFIEVVNKLWDSWEPDAVVGDRDTPLYADASRIHDINHSGDHFAVKGAMTAPRSPQGRPVIVQAGGSEGGRNLAARHADVVFTAQTTIEDALLFIQDIRSRAAAHGRQPGAVKIMPGLSTTIGSTEEEANRRWEQLDELSGGLEARTAYVASRLGVSVTELHPDNPIPERFFAKPTDAHKGSHAFMEAQLNLARRENLTIRELGKRTRNGHRLVVGTPEQVADTLEHWFRSGAGDGFNIMPDVFTSGAEAFVDHVVPELRRRGVFRHEYEGTTLREHLGLPVPERA